MSASTEKDYDPIKNPRPEDLHAYGLGSAMMWFSGLFAVVLVGYLVITKLF
jgi:hypothetical protein